MRRADELTRAFVRLADAMGRTPSSDEIALVEELAIRCGWGARDRSQPLLPSGVSHGVPWGLSIASGSSELRVFVEAQREPPSIASYWQAAQSLTRWLADRGANVDAFVAIVDALEPSSDAPFRIWHSVVLPVAGPPRWHAYLCIPPGRDDVVDGALARLGCPRPFMRPSDRVTIVSMDLAVEPRIKAYVLMPDVSASELPGSEAGRRFARTMLGDDRRIWWLVAHALSATTATRAGSCALHLGVPRHLDEDTAVARIRDVLRQHALDATHWERARAILGPHHFLSFQHRDGAPRITTYFMPEVAR